jgi:CRP/FNR family cyclic AMP-dependent transcriptional regulator
MAPLTVFDQITMHPFVGDLPSNWLCRLAAHGRTVLRHPGDRLFDEGAPARQFWLLRSGTVALDFFVPGRGHIVLERVGADSVVGWSWLIPPYRWTLGAVVAEPMRAVEFDAAGVRALIAEDADLGRELTLRLLAVLGGRLQMARSRLVELYAYRDDQVAARGPGRGDQRPWPPQVRGVELK